MIEEIDPHPDLIEYFNITHSFKSDLSVNVFTDNGENYNILSNINQNIFLLKKLNEGKLLKDENHICDCGIGLGNTLFEIYIQSLDIDKTFHFYGIDKQEHYINFIVNNLLHLWKDKLNIIKNDIMNLDYTPYNIVYSYSPFNNRTRLKEMYEKITKEILPGSLIVENSNFGRGHFNLLKELPDLEEIYLDGIYIYRKSN